MPRNVDWGRLHSILIVWEPKKKLGEMTRLLDEVAAGVETVVALLVAQHVDALVVRVVVTTEFDDIAQSPVSVDAPRVSLLLLLMALASSVNVGLLLKVALIPIVECVELAVGFASVDVDANLDGGEDNVLEWPVDLGFESVAPATLPKITANTASILKMRTHWGALEELGTESRFMIENIKLHGLV
ncbi:hypothetical protein TWF281_000248 [Arthrobotrys megalospora]